MTEPRPPIVDRLLAVRIVRWPFKLLYALGAYAVTFVVIRLLLEVGVSRWVTDPLSLVLDLTAIAYGARIFRGRNEEIAPPRPLWQLTARPTASRRLGTLFAVLFGFQLVALTLWIVSAFWMPIPGSTPQTRTAEFYFSSALLVLECFVLAVAFQNSAKHLAARMSPTAAPDTVAPATS